MLTRNMSEENLAALADNIWPDLDWRLKIASFDVTTKMATQLREICQTFQTTLVVATARDEAFSTGMSAIFSTKI